MRLFCVPTYGLSLRILHMHLRRMYSAAFGWNVLYISIKSIRSNVSFKVSVSWLTFCLDDISINVSVLLKSPTIIVLLSTSPFRSVNNCFIYFGAPMLNVYILINITPSWWLFPLSLQMSFFVSWFVCFGLVFWLEVYFIWYEYSYTHFLLAYHLLKVSSSIPSLWAYICL